MPLAMEGSKSQEKHSENQGANTFGGSSNHQHQNINQLRSATNQVNRPQNLKNQRLKNQKISTRGQHLIDGQRIQEIVKQQQAQLPGKINLPTRKIQQLIGQPQVNLAQQRPHGYGSLQANKSSSVLRPAYAEPVFNIQTSRDPIRVVSLQQARTTPQSKMSQERPMVRIRRNAALKAKAIHRRPSVSVEETQIYSQSEPDERRQDSDQNHKANLTRGKKLIDEKKFDEALNILKNNPLTEAHFLSGIATIDAGKSIDQAKSQFQQSLDKPESYVLLALCEKLLGNQEQTKDLIKQCLQKYPQLPEALLFRAIMYYQNREFSRALDDYRLCEQTQNVVMGQADCLRQLKRYSEAQEVIQKRLTVGSQTSDTISKVIWQMRKVEVQILAANYEGALTGLQNILAAAPQNLKAHYYLGKVLTKGACNERSLTVDAVLHLQKATQSEDPQVLANAFYRVAKLEISLKQFSNAYQLLDETSELAESSNRISFLQDFTLAVGELQLRRVKKGMQMLSDLVEILTQSENLAMMAYAYRAYAYCMLEKYELALADYKLIMKHSKLGQVSAYNMHLSAGIVDIDGENYSRANRNFAQASAIFPKNRDPYLLMVISKVQDFLQGIPSIMALDENSKWVKVVQAKQFMDKAIARCRHRQLAVRAGEKSAQLHFFRGLLSYWLHNFTDALRDFSVAINQQVESNAHYHLARGRAYACIGMIKRALRDFGVALKIDQTLAQAYTCRAKCHYLAGEVQAASRDLQKAAQVAPADPSSHQALGDLLMTIGEYRSAIKCYQNSDKISKTSYSLYQQARCFCALNRLEKSQTLIRLIADMDCDDLLLEHDHSIIKYLLALQKVSTSTETRTKRTQSSEPEDLEYHSYQKAVFEKGRDFFQQLISWYEAGTIDQLVISEAPICLGLIPCFDRARVEQDQVNGILHNLEKQQASDSSCSQSFSYSQRSVDSAREKLAQYPPFQKYRANIFSLEDLYLFRGVTAFHLGDYKKAIEDFDESHKSITKLPSQRNDSQHASPVTGSHAPSEATDLSQIGLSSLNSVEQVYNKMLCYLMLNDEKNCIQSLNLLGEACKQKYKDFFSRLQSLVTNFFKTGILEDEIFPPEKEGRLCSKFGAVCLKASGKPTFVKLSFSVPFVLPPNMIPRVDEAELQAEFSLKLMDAPQPEEPWQVRCKHQTKYKNQDQDATDVHFFSNQNPNPSPEGPTSSTQPQRIQSIEQRVIALQPRDLDEKVLSESDIPILEELCSHPDCRKEMGLRSQSASVGDQEDVILERSGASIGSDTSFHDLFAHSGAAKIRFDLRRKKPATAQPRSRSSFSHESKRLDLGGQDRARSFTSRNNQCRF